MKKKVLLIVMAVLAMVLLPFCALAETDGNLLQNAGFEELDENGLPANWTTDAYRMQEGYTLFSVTEDAKEGQYAAAINNLAENDARFAQTVSVEPESLYCLSGWIRTDSIPDSGHGANLSIEGVYVFSQGVYETEDWQYIEWYGETGEEQTEVTVFARVGGYSGESLGKASFDDLCLKKVDAVPAGVIASLWYDMPKEIVDIDPIDYTGDNETAASPFWPWLLMMAAIYVLLAFWIRPYLTRDHGDLTESQRMPAWVWAGLVIAFLTRMIVGTLVDGYPVDVNCFLSWGSTMAQVGPTQFYQATRWCDYPPAYVYVLGLNSLLADGIGRYTAGSALLTRLLRPTVIFKIIPCLCDVGMAYLLYRVACEEKQTRRQAGLLAMMLAYNPAFFLNSAAWCQMDAALCLGLMLVAWWAMRRKWHLALPMYMLCVLMKPQALMLGFLGLTAMVLEWLRHKESRRQMLTGICLALGMAAVVLIPFSIHQKWDWLIEQYANTLASYPYATVNTANFYYLFNANWVSIDAQANRFAPVVLSFSCLALGLIAWFRAPKRPIRWLESMLMGCFAAAFAAMSILGVNWAVIGITAMALAFVIVLPLYIRGGDLRNLPLLGGLLFLLLYVTGIKMHERYLFPALLFFLMAFVLHRDWRILLLAVATACTVFINSGIVLDNALRLGSASGHLNNDTRWLNNLISVINVACVPMGVWLSWRICVEHAAPVPCLLQAPKLTEKPGDPRHFSVRRQLPWKRADWILMLTVTLVYSVVALCNLGSTKAPQHPWKSTSYNEQVVIDLGEHRDDFYMLYFAQVSYYDFSVATSEDGRTWSDEHWAQMAEGECFRWKYLCDYTETGASRAYNTNARTLLSGRYVRITAQQVGLILDEVLLRDTEGNVLPASIASRTGENADSTLLSDPQALLDEQNTLSGEPSWYNSTYFDEIYHARTAFEHLNGTVPYETTHPPLGKVLMSFSIAIFGMTPFGWRFAGALAGILMLPAMYLLGRQLTGKRSMGFVAMCLMALDCMHLTQTRIATIDSFPVLFILWSYLFMLRFMQRDMMLDSPRKLLPDLALSGLFMGLGIASKWIGIYAGAGLAVLFFWTLVRHICMGYRARTLLANEKMTGEERRALEQRARQTWRRPLLLCLWCLLFFVLVPVGIYLLSYIPFFSYTKVTGLKDYIQKVIQAQINMFNYHATPGLGMDHPFYSPWYDWPLIKLPMYYAMARFVPAGYSYSIFCFGNPAVWIVGLAGIAATLSMWFYRKYYALPSTDSLFHWRSASMDVAPAVVLLGLLAQFLPWVLVPRGTYIYHYFASVPFLCLGTTLMLNWLRDRLPRIGKWVIISYLAVCLVLFIGFYPYASGVLTPTWWLDFMKQFLRLYHA